MTHDDETVSKKRKCSCVGGGSLSHKSPYDAIDNFQDYLCPLNPVEDDDDYDGLFPPNSPVVDHDEDLRKARAAELIHSMVEEIRSNLLA